MEEIKLNTNNVQGFRMNGQNSYIISYINIVDKLNDTFIELEAVEQGVSFEFSYSLHEYGIFILNQLMWGINDGMWEESWDSVKHFETEVYEYCCKQYKNLIEYMGAKYIPHVIKDPPLIVIKDPCKPWCKKE